MPFDEKERRILERVSSRIRQRKDSLDALSKVRQQGVGFEGWLKVETIAALKDIVEEISVKSPGPDLEMCINGETGRVELKAHNLTSFGWARNGAKKYATVSCLFLMKSGKNLARDIEKTQSEGFEIKVENIDTDWIIGLLKRGRSDCKKATR